MKSYKIKYKPIGCWFWRTLRGVTGDGLENGYRFFQLEDDTLIFIQDDSEFHFYPCRQAFITKNMSKEVGTQVVRS